MLEKLCQKLNDFEERHSTFVFLAFSFLMLFAFLIVYFTTGE